MVSQEDESKTKQILTYTKANDLEKEISSGKENLRNLALVYQTFPFVEKDIEKGKKKLTSVHRVVASGP